MNFWVLVIYYLGVLSGFCSFECFGHNANIEIGFKEG